RDKEGAGFYLKIRPRGCLADPTDTEFRLDLLEDRTDLFHCATNLLGVGLEGTRPIAQRLGVAGLDLGRIGRNVFAARLSHSAETPAEPICSAGSTCRRRRSSSTPRPSGRGSGSWGDSPTPPSSAPRASRPRPRAPIPRLRERW